MSLQSEIDRLWSALDKTNQWCERLEARLVQPFPIVTPLARPSAPTPDYGPGEPERCSCDEAEALRSVAAELRKRCDVLLRRSEEAEARCEELSLALPPRSTASPGGCVCGVAGCPGGNWVP
jgi:hypothetical protein